MSGLSRDLVVANIDFCLISHFLFNILVYLIFLYFQALSCLVQLASIRRSLFNNNERAKFLEQLVQGVKRILESPQVCI